MEVSRLAEGFLIRGLHRGESEALQLALATPGAAVLMDDLDARKAARRLGLEVAGTIAILELAAERDLIDFSQVVAKVRETNFFMPEKLIDLALQRNLKGKK